MLTICWNVVAGGLALGASLIAGSLSLGGFGLNTLIDMSASAVLVWRFWKDADDPEAAARLERRAEIAIGVAMLGVATYLIAQGLHALVTGSHPKTSEVGLGVTIASLLLLPWLSHRKARVALRLPSRALRADAILTGASAALAALTLAALAANSALGWWWADATAALMIAAVLMIEVTRAARAILGRAPARLDPPDGEGPANRASEPRRRAGVNDRAVRERWTRLRIGRRLCHWRSCDGDTRSGARWARARAGGSHGVR